MPNMIDITGWKDWAPYDGLGSSDLLTHDGDFAGVITKVILRKTQHGDKDLIVVAITVADKDNAGRNIVAQALCSGVDKNGTPLNRQLASLLYSTGVSQEEINKAAANKQLDLESMPKVLINKAVQFEVEAEMYENKIRSAVQNFVSLERYQARVASNSHRKPHREIKETAAAGSVFSMPPGTTGQAQALFGGAPANGPAASATAQMQSVLSRL